MNTKFKIRASAAGQIMAKPRNKSDLISKTAQTYCQNWLKEQIYNRKREITTKYMDKGLTVEDNAIDLAADYLGLGFAIKNEQGFENSHFTGTPDLLPPGSAVIDIKSSWDCWTFPLFDREIPNRDYYYQLQVYMNLTGRRVGYLVYCLMDTPEHIIEKEFNWNNPLELDFDEFKRKFVYDGYPMEQRVKVFKIEYSPEVIAELKARVTDCQVYINGLINNL